MAQVISVNHSIVRLVWVYCTRIISRKLRNSDGRRERVREPSTYGHAITYVSFARTFGVEPGRKITFHITKKRIAGSLAPPSDQPWVMKRSMSGV